MSRADLEAAAAEKYPYPTNGSDLCKAVIVNVKMQRSAYIQGRLVGEGLEREKWARIEAFLGGVHGMNEMNVVRGLRKVMAGEDSTFLHEVRLSVYGEWCGHDETPKHYPRGYGKCGPCRGDREDDE